MIKKLRRRFIALATVSLVVLLSLIVTGMNIMNYNKVVSDADTKLEVLAQNVERMKWKENQFDIFRDFDGLGNDNFVFGRGGKGGPRMSMDEAEESRFFSVTVNEDGSCRQAYIDRISAVDQTEAEEYAVKAMETGKESGFVDDFRYIVSESENGGGKSITFLDCGRTLESYRSFLRASVIMSLVGLALVFAAICYFAGRIIKPVAESYEKQKRFITDAGHEIKTPLAIIKANIDLMNMDLDDLPDAKHSPSVQTEVKSPDEAGDTAAISTSLKDSLDDISGQVDRLTGLTNDLVYLSRMEEGEDSLVMISEVRVLRRRHY